MGSALEGYIKDTAGGFDDERRETMPKNSWLALLGEVAADGTGNFRQLRFYRKGFITRSNNFRSGFYVEIATPENLQAVIQKTTHFSISGVCYEVSDGDTFPPSGDRFSWMIYGTWVKDVFQRQV